MTLFEAIGDVEQVEVIVKGPSLRQRARLRAEFGQGRWRKLKGLATVRYPNGKTVRVELHWYEAHGIGRRNLKVKRVLD